MGSTRAARRAGRYAATSVIAIIVTAPKAIGADWMLLRDRLRAPSVGLLVVGCLWTGFPLDTPRVVGLRLRIAGRRRSRLAA
jgi:hypothetical protein